LARIKKSCSGMIFKKTRTFTRVLPCCICFPNRLIKKNTTSKKRYHVIIVFIAGAKREDRYIHSLTFIPGYCIF
jgi:hypothetical protein